MDKKPIGYVKGQTHVLDKKVKANPKYEGVKKTLDTGLTVKNIEVISNQLVAKRKGEHFRRIRASQLATLLEVDLNQESIYNMNDHGQLDDQSVVTANSQISKATVTPASQQVKLAEQSEFILLDSREADEHQQWAIVQSVNCPFTQMLQDKWNQQVVGFKTKTDKLLIIYHLDEKHGIKVANHLFEKGYDNVYLLSGGLEDFTQDCHHLVQGTHVPPLLKKKEGDLKIQKRSNYKEPQNKIMQPNSSHYKDNVSELSAQFDRQSIQSKARK